MWLLCNWVTWHLAASDVHVLLCVASLTAALFLVYTPGMLLHLQTLPWVDSVQVPAAAGAQPLQAELQQLQLFCHCSCLVHDQAPSSNSVEGRLVHTACCLLGVTCCGQRPVPYLWGRLQL